MLQKFISQVGKLVRVNKSCTGMISSSNLAAINKKK